MSLPQNPLVFRSTHMGGCLITVAFSLLACGGGSRSVSEDASQVSSISPLAQESRFVTIEGRKSVTIGVGDPDRTGLREPAAPLGGGGAELGDTSQPISLGGSTGQIAAPVSPPTADPSPQGTVDVGCGPDIGGWTNPVPSRADTNVAFRDVRQPGSRIYYIDSRRGSDQTGEIYFWDGARIVDSAGRATDASGTAYGTDPIMPSAAVRPFKRWSYVGPRASMASDIGTPGTVGGATPLFRGGFPDWWLFARGETFDLSADLLSFEHQSNPAATSVNGSLAVPGGRSTTERQVVGAYGDICLPRPRFVHPQLGFVSRFNRTTDPTVFKNVAYLSLHFDGHDRTVGTSFIGVNLLGQTAASTDILFEDVWIDGTSVSQIQSAAAVTFRRSIITDSFSENHSPHAQGLFYYGADKSGILRIDESILLRNGFTGGDPSSAWPPSGTQYWDMYSRNMYFSGMLDPSKSWFRDSISMKGASGDQFRGGMRVERSFFFQGYVAHGGYNGAYSQSTGSFVDNVIQKFQGSGTNDNRGQPGWGLTLGGGATQVEVARNIITNAGDTSVPWRSLAFVPSTTDCIAGKTNLRAPNRGNMIHDNIIDAEAGSSAIEVAEGVRDVDQPCLQWTFRSTTGNEVSNNVLINSKLRASLDVVTPMAAGTTTDTVFANNRMFPSRASAGTALGWTDGGRSLKSYLQSLGVAVKSDDGFPEYFSQAVQQRRGQWRPKWTANSLVNYFRAGFGMTPLPLPGTQAGD